jgi:hypothetical protein
MRPRSVLAALAASGLIAAGSLAAAGPASAAQSNLKIPPGTQIDLGPATCAPGELILTVKSGHDNIVVNGNGYHENATIQGDVQTVDYYGNVLASGHGEAWFTVNETNGAFVDTDVVNAQVGGTKIHLAGTFVVNANGSVTVDNQTASCH